MSFIKVEMIAETGEFGAEESFEIYINPSSVTCVMPLSDNNRAQVYGPNPDGFTVNQSAEDFLKLIQGT